MPTATNQIPDPAGQRRRLRGKRPARKMWARPLYNGRGGEEEEIPLHRRPYADFIPTPTEEVGP